MPAVPPTDSPERHPERRAERGPSRPLQQRLVLLFLAGWLLLNFPLLRLLWTGDSWWGLPRGALLLFGVWALLIAVLAWWLESDEPEA